jgi:hypothetical protein
MTTMRDHLVWRAPAVAGLYEAHRRSSPLTTLANTSAFISDIATISRVLGAFANGQLKTGRSL